MSLSAPGITSPTARKPTLFLTSQRKQSEAGQTLPSSFPHASCSSLNTGRCLHFICGTILRRLNSLVHQLYLERTHNPQSCCESLIHSIHAHLFPMNKWAHIISWARHTFPYISHQYFIEGRTEYALQFTHSFTLQRNLESCNVLDIVMV